MLDPVARIALAETFFGNTNADIRYGGGRAYYNIASDFVQMPPFETFKDAESYYATLAHETTHWTRHEKRLNREFGRKRSRLGRPASFSRIAVSAVTHSPSFGAG